MAVDGFRLEMGCQGKRLFFKDERASADVKTKVQYLNTGHRKKPYQTGLTNECPNRMHYINLMHYHFSPEKEYLVFQAMAVLETVFFKKEIE